MPKLSGNEYLTLASTFHGLHAISSQLAPVISGGIERLEADTFTLQCYQTPTGLKFFLTAKPGTPSLNSVCKAVYELYSDYVLKVSLCRLGSVGWHVCGGGLTLVRLQNPFYELDMPIRCELFDKALEAYVKSMEG